MLQYIKHLKYVGTRFYGVIEIKKDIFSVISQSLKINHLKNQDI